MWKWLIVISFLLMILCQFATHDSAQDIVHSLLLLLMLVLPLLLTRWMFHVKAKEKAAKE